MKAVNVLIDMHTHILPGVDDGAANISDALDMLKESANQGVTLCAATSHIHPADSADIQDFLKRRQEAYSKLIKACKGCGVPDIILGAEVHMDRDISGIDGIHQLCIGDTDFMLVELPFVSHSGTRCVEWLYNLNLKGIIPIIAHIDRYSYRSELIENITGIRVVYQVNNARANEIGGRRFIKKLLDTGYMVIMSSDMHNMTNRPCDMKKSYEMIKKKMPKYADDLFGGNADILLNI